MQALQEGGGEHKALYVREQLRYTELCLGTDDEPAGNLWVGTKEQTSMSDTMVGVCYRPPDQEEQVAEAFAGPGPHGGLEPPWYLLEDQHNAA